MGAERLQVIPEAVDVDLFDASRHSPLDQLRRDPRFKFLSIFKWETRKGWDVLLSAFLSGLGLGFGVWNLGLEIWGPGIDCGLGFGV